MSVPHYEPESERPETLLEHALRLRSDSRRIVTELCKSWKLTRAGALDVLVQQQNGNLAYLPPPAPAPVHREEGKQADLDHHPQAIPAFVAALLAEGVEPAQVERAVGRVEGLRPGQSLSGANPLWRAFAFEQARLLENAL